MEARLPEAVEKQIATGALDAVEEAWLQHLEAQGRDLPYFIAVARRLAKAGESETARFLLELVDETLRDGGHWNDRFVLLRKVGPLLFEAQDLHQAILDNLEHLYGDRPSYEAMTEKVGLNRAIEDIPKTWKKADRLITLLSFDVGAIVRMEGKGAGRVVEVNMQLESFKIDFHRGLELRVGFSGAAKLLEPLPPGHFLRRQYEEPEALEKLRDTAPGELVRSVLESYEGPRTGAEIKRALSGLISASKWSSWWAAARKHPQLMAEPGGRRYIWAASSQDAQKAIWQTFEAADARTRIDLLRREGARDPELKVRMAEVLSSQAGELVADDASLACEIGLHLERAGSPIAGQGSPEVLIAESEEAKRLLAGIRDRVLRERSYAMAREMRRDWLEVFGELMWHEQDPRSIDLLSGDLKKSSPQRLDSLFDQIVSQPRKGPAAFVWLAERASDRAEWLERTPIRLLKQILGALSSDVFAAFRTRLRPLVESGGTVPRLVAVMNESQAAEALAAIEKSHGLENFERQPLMNAIYLRFPNLRQEDETPLYATQASIDAKRAELKKIAEVEIPANRRAIEEAREMGDLRENFEYKSARQRHEYLSARAGALNGDLARVRPIDSSQVTGAEVVIGCRVQLEPVDEGKPWTITILGPWESDPENDVLSNEAQLARNLLGRKVGEGVELAGGRYRIEAVKPHE